MTLNGDPPFGIGSPFGAVSSHFRGNWGWIVALGVLATVLGVAALVLTATATIASVLVIGFFMIVAGIMEVTVGFRARGWGRILYWEVAGVLYVVAGVFAVSAPIAASVVITLMLGAGLLATGAVRLVLGYQMRGGPLRTPLVIGGVATALLGLVIVLGWPGNSLIALGTLLGIDLMFSGLNWIFFGLRFRSHG